ncbi:MAG: NAD(P)-dependent alcohol dehydrogenase [Nevskia sp.]
MKAAIYDRYGAVEVLEVRELPRPEPARGELLVKVAAAAVNPKDALTRSGKFRRLAGPSFPKRVGYDFAGTVASVGEAVPGFAPGEAVFGMLNGWAAGSCAEYLIAQAGELARKPARLSFDEAAALPLAAQTALQALRDLAAVKADSRVLIHGASGGVGTLAVQIAKALGAEVTALCGADSAALVKSLGADVVHDYRRQEPAALGERYDCIFDVFGNQSFGRLKARLRPRGVYVTTVPNARNVLDHLRTRLWPGRRARLVVVKSRRRDLETLSGWVESGRLRALIAAVVPLSEIRHAHELIQTRRTHGKIIVKP